jgi:hypothetical protein
MELKLVLTSGVAQISTAARIATSEVAREEAKLVALDLSRNRTGQRDERLIVTDADGKVIHEEPLFPH